MPPREKLKPGDMVRYRPSYVFGIDDSWIGTIIYVKGSDYSVSWYTYPRLGKCRPALNLYSDWSLVKLSEEELILLALHGAFEVIK